MKIEKVALLTPTFPMISETFVVDHVRMLGENAAGVFCTQFDEKLFQGLGLNVPVQSFEPTFPAPGLRNSTALKMRWHLQRLRKTYRWAWPPDVQARLLRLLRQTKPTQILVEFGTIAAWSFPALHRLRLPYVVHFHGIDASSTLGNESFVRCLKRMLSNAKAVIVVSQRMEERLKAIAPNAQFRSIPCGVEVAEQPVTRQPSPDICRFLAVGRLVEKKAPIELLTAFKATLQRVKGVEVYLEIIGDGPLRGRVETYIRENGLQNNVNLRGFADHAAVLERMTESDVFAQHSVVAPNGDREGSPVAIMEAAGAALPIVSTRHEGICETVVDGQSGFLVEEHDTAAMANHMTRLALDPELRQRMGVAGWKHARSTMTRERTWARLRNVLSL